MPRLTFKRTDKNGNIQVSKSQNGVVINFSKGSRAETFWKLISFLYRFKELVDVGEFEKKFKVESKNDYFITFNSKNKKEQIEDLKELIEKSEISEDEVKSILKTQRQKTIRGFFYLLKNTEMKGVKSMDVYKEKYSLRGDEAVWHHFLKKNSWLLGLNVDIKFINTFIDEAKIGIQDTTGSGSPLVDLIGVSNYTILVELKTSKTKIFKIEKKSGDGSRANTWAFSSEFINGVSQSIAQKTDWDKSAKNKDLIKEGEILNQDKYRTLDPKVVFIIGSRNEEFPHNGNKDNIFKSETFERFRRNSRNLEIITYDELFERAYHIVYSQAIKEDWYEEYDFVNIVG